MKLWKLEGNYHVLLIRAESESAARQMAAEDDRKDGGAGTRPLDPAKYTCVEIVANGDPEIIIDFEA
jgi:hypothetical protein